LERERAYFLLPERCWEKEQQAKPVIAFLDTFREKEVGGLDILLRRKKGERQN